MSRWGSNAAKVLDEQPILIGDGYEVFEGWDGLTPEQIAECERAQADAGVRHEDVQRAIAEMRARQGE